MTARTAPSLAALLRLSQREKAGLTWLKTWARSKITGLKRRRKYLPKCGYSEEEAATLKALIDLEAAAGQLIELTTSARVEAGADPGVRLLAAPAIEKSLGRGTAIITKSPERAIKRKVLPC